MNKQAFLACLKFEGTHWLWCKKIHRSGVPMTSTGSARVESIRLFAPERIQRGLAPSCGESRCVHPDHLKLVTDPEIWFWPQVRKSQGCWEWLGNRTPAGYGRTGRKFGTRAAHRFAWESTYGAIPAGLNVLHKCDNPPCVRPTHLFLGTQSDNRWDCVHKGREPRGAQKTIAKLTEAQVLEIRRRILHESATHLSAVFGVTRQNINLIHKRKTWTHI